MTASLTFGWFRELKSHWSLLSQKSRWVYTTKWPQEEACSSGLPLFSERKRKPEKLENTTVAIKKQLHQRSWTKFHQDQGQLDKATKMTNIIKGCSVLPNMNTKAKQNIKTIVVKSIPLYHCWPSEQPSLPRPRKQPTLSKEELHQAGLRPRRTLFTFPRSKPCLHLTLYSKMI